MTNMQTILGANGQIGDEVAKELKRRFTSNLRLVNRNPTKIHDTDSLFAADLMDAVKTNEAVKGSKIAYLTVGLPPNTEMWEKMFPVMMKNTIAACQNNKAKLVFFDNTYMYPQDGEILTEETRFAPVGKKGEVRAEIARMLLKEIEAKTIEAVICRAPEFYGPGRTQGITNTLIFDKIKQGKRLQVLLRDDVLRSLIWTPDASRATAWIGNTPDAFNQTWHLPIDDNRLTYKQFIALVSNIYGKPLHYEVVSKWKLKIGSLFKKELKEIQELLPRYEHNNLFDSSKFKQRFPDFPVTTYKQGIEQILSEAGN